MGYRTLRACLNDLAATGQLVRIDEEIDPHLEAAEIHRRVFQAGGPAIYFARVKGCRFPMASNLFGTMNRMRFIFRDTLDDVRRLIELKADPMQIARHPWQQLGLLPTLGHMLPKRVRTGAVMAQRHDDRRVAPIEILARRRRSVYHAAVGLYRRRRRTRLSPLEPRHVPRAVHRRAVSP